MKTEQEKFWKGDFGTVYIERNKGDISLASKTSLFSNVLERTGSISSALEFGCNIGLNLQAISRLLPNAELTGVEINSQAAELAQSWGGAEIIEDSILDVNLEKKFDLTFTAGVLIHISPDFIENVYQKLFDYSHKFIMVAEYYNPTPVTIPYRGHAEKLYKRDFAGEMLDLYPELRLIDYRFNYHKDPIFPQDDITWFLMSKG